MEDIDYIKKANELLVMRSYTRSGLAKAIGVSRYKLDKLSNKIDNMPLLLTRSQAATKGVKSGRIRWGSNFRLPGSPTTGRKK